MTVTLKRQLNDDEKTHILKTHGRKCFATGHAIADDEDVHFDHIQAFSHDGLNHSIGLQPRYLMSDKVFEMYRHFQRHPVLLPSIGRLVGNRIKLFDGQHKIAGLLWTGRRQFECKIYTEYDIRLLNLTNI